MESEVKITIPLPDHPRSLDGRITDRRGCYAVFNSKMECLYVGRSGALRKRIIAHYINQNDGLGMRWRLSGHNFKRMSIPSAPDGCTLVVWFNEFYHLLEVMLIKEFAPVHNSCQFAHESRMIRSAKIIEDVRKIKIIPPTI